MRIVIWAIFGIIAISAVAIVTVLQETAVTVSGGNANANALPNPNINQNTNSSVNATVNTNTVVVTVNANANANSNANVNTNAANTNTVVNVNTSTNTNNSNTNQAPPLLSVAEVTADPSRYHNTRVCIEGYYQNSFEFYAFGGGIKDDSSGTPQITKPYIWTESSVPPSMLSCVGQAGERQVCTGYVTACGTFQYSAGAGFGHVGAYQYQLASL